MRGHRVQPRLSADPLRDRRPVGDPARARARAGAPTGGCAAGSAAPTRPPRSRACSSTRARSPRSRGAIRRSAARGSWSSAQDSRRPDDAPLRGRRRRPKGSRAAIAASLTLGHRPARRGAAGRAGQPRQRRQGDRRSPRARLSAAAAAAAARELACVRGGRRVFAGLSFALAPGDALVLRGPNGSGKSSLLRLLAGFLAPAARRARLGRRARSPTIRAAHRAAAALHRPRRRAQGRAHRAREPGASRPRSAARAGGADRGRARGLRPARARRRAGALPLGGAAAPRRARPPAGRRCARSGCWTSPASGSTPPVARASSRRSAAHRQAAASRCWRPMATSPSRTPWCWSSGP